MSGAAAARLLALFGLVAGSTAASAAQDVAARSAQGWLVGQRAGDAGAVFRGVPYAMAPLAALRWRPPLAPAPWSGRRRASAAAAPCLQADFGWNADDAARSSEDCLYLDIRTPNLHPQRPLPVMVWIHGGSNRAGSARGIADSDITRRGVVLVCIQYRLGVFGFLSHPALTRESHGKAAGNFAVLDQIAALRWVRRNIAAFGGDPRNVTIFGHSAGAEDVGLLLLSPLARGLFAKAIEQSGSPGFGLPPRSLADNEALGLQLSRILGSGDDAAALAVLRSRDGREILAAGEALRSPTLRDRSYLWLQVSVDGHVLPLAPREILAAGRANPVALIIGSNTRELTIPGGDEQTDAFLADSFGEHEAAARSLYGYRRQAPAPAGDARYGSFSERLSGDVIFRCPAARTAGLQAAAGQPVWQYQFGRIDSARQFGHAAELAFVFDDLPVGAAQDGAAVSLQAYWVGFAQRGNPNGPGLPSWPRYDPQRRAYLDFSATGPQVDSNLGGPVCALLDRV
ncbi:MAG TPA: carboxylesterase family protein [Steroidobacteraceae bacterium]|nr:carboxylesterase family protein [Steroidobacteraceae bacterium]